MDLNNESYKNEYKIEINCPSFHEEDKFYNKRGFRIENSNKNLLKYLVEHGADINKENIFGEIPLFKACKSGNKDIVEYLVEQVEQRANINKENEIGETPLFRTWH